MEGMPIIKLELDDMRERIIHAYASRSDEFNEMVAKALDKTLCAENLQALVEVQVQKAVDDAIKSISSNYIIQSIVRQIVIEALHKKQKELEKQNENE